MWHPGQRPLLWGPTAQTQRPLSHFSLFPLSHPPLILIQPGMPFALYGLLHSHGPLRATTALKYSFTTQNHIISMCSRRQLRQIEHVSPVGGGECFPALDAARPVSSKTQWYSLCYYHPRENRSPLWGGSEAKLHGFCKANWLCITHIKCFANLMQEQHFPSSNPFCSVQI